MMKNLILGLMVLAALAGCRSVKYVPVETVRTDSIYIHSLTRDSIRLVDSVYVREKGDTVTVERWRYAYRDRLLRDTLYITRTDSVQVPYPVEKELTRWQQFRLDVGGYAIVSVIILILAAAGYMVYRLKKGGN